MAEQGVRKWVITITMVLACMLEFLDTTIVNVAIPHIQGNMGAILEDVAWVTTGYAVANVIILPMSGWLGNRFGRKNYFLFSIIVFTIASMLCGNSTTLIELILFRVLQGLAGGGLISTAQAILLETWPPEERGTATAIFGFGAVVGPTIAPALGGYLTDTLSWPWVFYINLPLGILAAVLTHCYVRETPKSGVGKPVDWWGILLLTIAVGSLQTVLEKGEEKDWFATNYIIVLTAAAVIGILLFIWRETTTEHPVVNFQLFRYRSFSAGMVTSFVFGIGLYGSVFIFPQYCQTLLGFSAEQTGLLLLPGQLFTISLMPIVGKVLKKGVPPQLFVIAGFLCFFVFPTLMSRATLSSGLTDFYFPLNFRGIGIGMLFVPLITLAIKDLKGPEIGQGAGLYNMMRQLGGSFGIAGLATRIHIGQSVHRNFLLENVNEYNPAYQERIQAYIQGFMGKGFSHADAVEMALKAVDGVIKKQSMLMSFSGAYQLLGIVMLCCIPLVFLQGRNKKQVALPADAH
ncbi:DHA2 family efflux MFS transporter permease subunit [Chitinophaga nivalis]|uniref:DHA2 family efflux MFS transporter permease subunit n=1 Tax=Chitinophaga nivalis TaxID=2991709 RepID=A0ABT3IKQ6_9BACT|nr:DHA2 family efflux MFS transporter permease subunit [Chitinophaga nivalis]MCW3465775.1 DHA2 family efflux MFS transporter permease subunit [Chitinophaga nivalis]MCW3484534.1 DHA2 family efflux MFS transporter permease subunit [Chitinophaga nivalis]